MDATRDSFVRVDARQNYRARDYLGAKRALAEIEYARKAAPILEFGSIAILGLARKRLVVLFDVGVCAVEQILVRVQLVFQQGLAQLLLYQPFTLGGVLPVGEAHLLHDVVDIGDDALDDDVRVAADRLTEVLCP